MTTKMFKKVLFALLTSSFFAHAGTFTAEYSSEKYDITPFSTPYTLSIPTRNGTPLSKIKAVVISTPGVGTYTSSQVDERWTKWLYENDLAFLDVGGAYKAPSSILGALTNLAGIALGGTTYSELEDVPVMVFGESAGGSSSSYFAWDAPDRTICFVVEHTRFFNENPSAATLAVPGYFRWGEFDFARFDEGYYSRAPAAIKPMLQAGAQWMCVAEARQQHASKRYAIEEAMGFFSLMLPLRYDYQEGVAGKDPSLGSVGLTPIARADGYLGEHNYGDVITTTNTLANLHKDWESRDPYYAPYDEFERNDKEEHSWMASKAVAAFWATKFTHGEHDLIIEYLDTIQDDLGGDAALMSRSYFPNIFTTDQQVRMLVDPTGFTNTVRMEYYLDGDLVATDHYKPYEHSYTFSTNQTGVHFIYPVAVAANGERCVGMRRLIQVYSNVRGANTSPKVSDIDPQTGTPGQTLNMPITVWDDETDASSLSVSWKQINCTDNFSSSDYTASITGTGSNRTLQITLPATNGILWGAVQVSDGDMSVSEYVTIDIVGDGSTPPFFVTGEAATAAGSAFEIGAWSRRISMHVYDYDTPIEDLTLTVIPSTPANLPPENIRVGGTGRFRYFQLKPLGGTSIQVTLSDGNTSITNGTIWLSIRSKVNTTPILSDIPDQTASYANESDPIEVRLYDLHTPSEKISTNDSPLTLSVTSDNQSLIADGDITVSDAGARRFIQFTPTYNQTGTATLTAIASDEDSSTVSNSFTVTVGAPETLTASTSTLHNARIAWDYRGGLDATGGIEPYTWSVLSGALPLGLSLQTDGQIIGSPSVEGTNTFTAQVIDSNPTGVSTSSATYTLIVEPWVAYDSNLNLTVLSDTVTVPEASNNTIAVRLTAQPPTTKTVTVSRISGDTDISVTAGTSLVFTTNNWGTYQYSTLSAADDADTDDGVAIIEYSTIGISPVEVTATEDDDDLAIEVNTLSLTVPEGGSTNLLVRLNTLPNMNVTVSVTRVSGDTSISVSPSSLTFTPATGADWQPVTLSAAQDADQDAGVAVARLSSSASANVNVTVTEDEDDFTVIHTGLLAAWNLDDVSGVVTSSTAYLMATGLVQSVLTHSDVGEIRTSSTAMKAIDNDEATIANAISAGNYFYWQIEPQSNYVVTITSIVVRTETDGSTATKAFVVSDASGLDAGSVLIEHTNGLESSAADLSGQTEFELSSDPIEFRVYGYNSAKEWDALYIGKKYNTDNSDDILVYGSVAYSVPSEPSADEDADGLPDDWETQHFGSNAIDPNAPASNGVNTVQQAYIAGLNPTNPSSFFKISDLRENVLQWAAVSGRIYSVEWSTNLLNGFQPLETNLTAGVFTDAVNQTESEIFYRINVRLEE